ncbi:MAG: glycosyltransferase [Ferruginibacter sp.]|nr:glycosyltransferase [Cytophagales bacterium]
MMATYVRNWLLEVLGNEETRPARTAPTPEHDRNGFHLNATDTARSPALITIITTVLNGEKFLESTLLSVIAQKSRAPVKYIVVDGGSSDGTLDVIKKYAYAIDHWISEPDQGIYDAMNKGWQLAGENSFILFLGAGDKILTLPAVHHLSGDEVVFGRVFFNGKHPFVCRAGFLLRITNTLHHQALLVHKKLQHSPPFDTQFRTYADFDFNQRLLKKKVTFVHSPDFSAYALPGGFSGRFNVAESLRVVKKNFGFIHAAFGYFYHLYSLALKNLRWIKQQLWRN